MRPWPITNYLKSLKGENKSNENSNKNLWQKKTKKQLRRQQTSDCTWVLQGPSLWTSSSPKHRWKTTQLQNDIQINNNTVNHNHNHNHSEAHQVTTYTRSLGFWHIMICIYVEQCVLWIEDIWLIGNILNEPNTKIMTVYCVQTICSKSMQNEKYLDVQNDFGRQNICVYLYPMNSIPFTYMSHSQMLGKFEYGLPAKFWRLVGCTEMLSW